MVNLSAITNLNFFIMPANKRRSRNGNGNTSSPSAAVSSNLKSSNSITKFFNNINGFANGSNYNGYHPTIINHHVNSVEQLNSTSVSVNGGSNGGSLTTFTAKQQQQLDRNAFLLTLTKDQLKVECRKRGQKTTGTKTELVALFSLYIYTFAARIYMPFVQNDFNSVCVFFFSFYWFFFARFFNAWKFIIYRICSIFSLHIFKSTLRFMINI